MVIIFILVLLPVQVDSCILIFKYACTRNYPFKSEGFSYFLKNNPVFLKGFLASVSFSIFSEVK